MRFLNTALYIMETARTIAGSCPTPEAGGPGLSPYARTYPLGVMHLVCYNLT